MLRLRLRFAALARAALSTTRVGGALVDNLCKSLRLDPEALLRVLELLQIKSIIINYLKS
jgi:hypothetical protein